MQDVKTQSAKPQSAKDVRDLVQLHPEEPHGGLDAAREHAERAEYEAQLQFAGIQLRARAHVGEVWKEYREASIAENAVGEILNTHWQKLGSRARQIFSHEGNRRRAATCAAFEMWRLLNALAYADARDELSGQDADHALTALIAYEQGKADDLLKSQAFRARERRERDQAEQDIAREQEQREADQGEAEREYSPKPEPQPEHIENQIEPCPTCGSRSAWHNCVFEVEADHELAEAEAAANSWNFDQAHAQTTEAIAR